MSKTLKNTLAGFAVAALMLMGAGSAKAATIAELQALIADLTAQLSALSGGSSSCGYMHSMTLRQGMSGSQVMALQTALGISADGKFGPMTANAVMNFQGSHGLTKDGVVGPMTGAKICAGNPNPGNPNPSNPGLEGDFGTISDVNELSSYNNEEVGEGSEDVKVLGMEVEADSDGDVMIQSMKVSFEGASNTGSDNLDDYIDSVSIWMGDEMVGEADVEDFSEDSSVYTKTIAIDDSIVRADDTEKFYIAVTAVNNLDSDDISGDAWTVDVENIRFEDGSGVVTTETGYDLNGMNVPIDFVTFSQSSDTELKVRADSDSPEAGIVVIDESDETDDVVLLTGSLELEGDSDANIDEIPVTFTVGGTATDVDNVTGSVTLVLDGEEYTETVSTSTATSTTITFDDLDFDMSAGDEIDFEIRADIYEMDANDFVEGDTLLASITSTNRSAIDVENEEGDQLDDSSEKSGTAIGEAQEFRTQGIMLELVSTDADVMVDDGALDDTGTFTIKFKVTAVGDDAYIATHTPLTYYPYTVDVGGTATTVGVSAVIVNNTDSDLTSAYNWLIEEGESETLTLTVSKVNAAGPAVNAGLTRAVLTGVKWDDTDDNSPDNTYSSNMDDFKTEYVSMN